MSEALPIKPHHFVDILADFGRGRTDFQPHPYGHDLHTVAARILAEHDLRLLIAVGADAVCEPCRHNAEGICVDGMPDSQSRYVGVPEGKEEWNRRIDGRWCAVLRVSEGEETTAAELCGRLLGARSTIGEIYRELPPSYAQQKSKDLAAGIQLLLSR
jgi:hypothetical protein